MPGVLDLETIAVGLLAEAVRWLDEVAGLSVPDRRYIAPGHPDLVAWDCEQLVVACRGVAPGIFEGLPPFPGVPGPEGGLQIRHATFSIQLVRCTPATEENGDPPSPEDVHAAGLTALRDCGALSQLTVDLAANPTTPERVGWLPRGGRVQGGTVNQIGPSGLLHGYEALCQITADRVV